MEELMAKVQEILGSAEGQKQFTEMSQMLGLGEQNAPEPDLNLLMQVQSLMSGMNQEDDDTRLLMALKPHFGEERRGKIDRAVKFLRLLSLLPLLKESGFLEGVFGNDGQ